MPKKPFNSLSKAPVVPATYEGKKTAAKTVDLREDAQVNFSARIRARHAERLETLSSSTGRSKIHLLDEALSDFFRKFDTA